MTKKEKIFDGAAQPRIQGPEKMDVAVTGIAPAKKVTRTKITLSITPEDSDIVKMYALKNHTTVSDLLHTWIQENCLE